jgi:hypothetical protein
MKNYPAHFIGIICWLPLHKIERARFSSGQGFVAVARFTSNLSGPVLEALVNYSPIPELLNGCYKVRLHFRTLDGKEDEIRKLAKNTEILIMDAYKVIAVCRNISLPNFPVINMNDEWSSE